MAAESGAPAATLSGSPGALQHRARDAKRGGSLADEDIARVERLSEHTGLGQQEGAHAECAARAAAPLTCTTGRR